MFFYRHLKMSCSITLLGLIVSIFLSFKLQAQSLPSSVTRPSANSANANNEMQKETITTFSFEQFYKLIEDFKKLEAGQFIEKVSDFKSKVSAYLLQKKRICNGEVRDNPQDNAPLGINLPTVNSPRRLTGQERTQCFNELKVLYTKYRVELFSKRKEFLNESFKKELIELEKSHQKTLDDFEKLFGTDGRRR
jgi:hypothetical protein